jgi:hypothetical protein
MAETRTLRFKECDNPVVVKITGEPGKEQSLSIETPEGPVTFDYYRFVRFAQALTVLLRPQVILET